MNAKTSLQQSLAAISVNAHSLVDDASLLFQNGRFARTIALSVLAIEEVGKYYMVKSGEYQESKNAQKHLYKQSIAAHYVSAEFFLAVYENFFVKSGV